MNMYKRMNKHKRLLLVAALLLFALPLAADSFEYGELMEFGDGRAFGVEINKGQPDHTFIEVWREPLLAGTHEMTAAAKSKSTDKPLMAIRYMVADDDNNDGTIQLSEYVVVASATAVLENGWKVARCPAVVVSASKDAYRVETIWDHDGEEYVSADTVIRLGLLDEDGD